MTKVAISNLKNTTEYQTGSIVSRTLLHKKSGSITYFALDAGQEISEHTTPYDAMIHILEGEVEVTISNDIHNLKEGDQIIMPANDPHALKAITPYKMTLIMMKD
jgi:quercetin dioxygenase-like cupin family protein